MAALNGRKPGGPPLYTLDPIIWSDDDPYRDPAVFRASERMWWHHAIAKELRRLRDGSFTRFPGGLPAYPVAGIAGNIRGFNAIDTARYCRQMITWGELVKAEPLWDFEPDMWVALAEPKGGDNE
jgi:hypothetical protein